MTTINIRVDEDVKNRANELFEDLGLDMSTALNLFLRQSIYCGGIPFEIKRPNSITLAAMEEVRKIRNGELQAKRYDNVAEMFADLEAE